MADRATEIDRSSAAIEGVYERALRKSQEIIENSLKPDQLQNSDLKQTVAHIFHSVAQGVIVKHYEMPRQFVENGMAIPVKFQPVLELDDIRDLLDRLSGDITSTLSSQYPPEKVEETIKDFWTEEKVLPEIDIKEQPTVNQDSQAFIDLKETFPGWIPGGSRE